MTTEEVIKLAREAGLRNHIAFFSDSEVAVALARFAALVAEAEREACAKVCEQFNVDGADAIAADIRARSTK